MQLRVVLTLGIGLSSLTPWAQSREDSIQIRHRSLLLEAWKIRVERNGGVHAWTSAHAGMRVFQEWAALLSLAKDSGSSARRRWGKALERYVVAGNIRPFGKPGTDLPIPGTEPGDFDMTAMNAVSLVKLFEKDRMLLTDRTYLHLVRELIQATSAPEATFDVAFLRFPETENHLFMMESNRFLMHEIGARNPRGLSEIKSWNDSLMSTTGKNWERQRAFLLQAMQNVLRRGFFEANAKIYQRFTAQALDNLYSFASDSAIANGAGSVLDYLSTVFALQSLGSIRYGPYRRSAETFSDPALVDRDPLCSFFAVQSGKYPWDPDPRDGFWQAHTAHASTALFSSLLRYRLPEPFRDWMREKTAEYEVEIRSGYAADGEEAVERYAGGLKWLLTAGGRYAKPLGMNFPILRNWNRHAPWVYDVIARPSSLIFFPTSGRWAAENDIIHTRSGWDGNQLSLNRRFLYAYAPDESPLHDAWPFFVPKGQCPDSTVWETPSWFFRFCDRSNDGVFLVFSKLKARPWRWPWQKTFVRGGLELVPISQIHSIADLRRSVLDANRLKLKGPAIPYVNVEGRRMLVNTRCGPGQSGFLFSLQESKADAWVGLLRAQFLKDGKEFAFVDGRGKLRFRNPVSGQIVAGDFREWWRPMRSISTDTGGMSLSGK